MDYYLPTTLKLVHVYTDFEKQDLESEQVIRARQDIETTLDTIIEAFHKNVWAFCPSYTPYPTTDTTKRNKFTSLLSYPSASSFPIATNCDIY